MNKHVLLVDNNEDILTPVSLVLREAGYDVTSTNNGADALCLLGAKPPPDLLMLDLRMPGLDGHDVLKSLGPSSPPVILVTGDVPYLEEITSKRVIRVLKKPFDQTQLLEAVKFVLG